MEEADESDNLGDSDTTGEQTEGSEDDNEPPVIDNGSEGDDSENTDTTPEDNDASVDEETDAANSVFGMDDPDVTPFAENATYTVSFQTGTGYTFAADNATSATAGTDFTFTVSLAEGYKDLQVTAYTNASDKEGSKVTVEELAEGSENGTYTGTIKGATLTALTETDGSTITVEASATPIPKYTLTVPQASTIDGISKVEYSTDATTWTDASANTPEFEENTDVYVKVTADEGYNYTVKKQYTGDTEAAEAVKESEKDYYKFQMTANLTLTITAAEIVTSYEVTVTGVGDTDDAELTWATDDVTVDDTTKKITVAADKDLKFKVNVKEAKAETTKIDSVKYTIAGGTEEEINADSEGVYTIGSNKITGTVAIAVTTAPFADYTLTFTYDDEKIAAPVIKVNGNALAADKWAEAAKTATVSEKDSVSFTLAPKTGSKYVVNEVTFSDSETSNAKLDPQEDKSYLLGQLNGNTTVNVTDKLDEEQANRLTLAAAEGGNARGYSVTFKQDTDALDFDDAKTYKNTDKIVTLVNSFYALIAPSRGFQLESAAGTADGVTITKVEAADAPAGITVADGELLYKISYTKAAALELKVKATAVPSEEEQTVLFSNKSARLTYKLADEEIKQAGNKKNTYIVPKGSTAFDFSIDALVGYKPEVSYVDAESNTVTVAPNGDGVLTNKNKAKTFSYSLAVGELPDNTVITMNDAADTQAVKVTYVEDDVEIENVRIGAKEYTSDEAVGTNNEDGTYTVSFPVPHGETLTFTVTAQDNCEIIKTVTDTGKGAKTDTKKKTSFEASFKADATATSDQTLVITSQKNYVGVLNDTTDQSHTYSIDPVRNVYPVDYNHTYTVRADYGTNGAAELSKVLVKKKGNAEVEGVTATLAENKKSASFTINDKAAEAKDLTVELYTKDNTTDNADVTLKLSVRPVLTKVTVTGVNKSGTLEQTVDTVKDHAVKVDPKTASNAELHAVVDPAVDGFSVNYDTEEGKLSVTTSQTLDATATVKFYTLTAGKEDVAANRTYIEKDKGGEFTVKSVAQISSTATKPTMKLASSDDRTLTLALTAPKTIVDAKTGKVLYEVTIKSKGAADGTKDETTAQANVTTALTAAGTTFYVPKQAGALSQSAVFTVNSAAEGAGDAWQYDVSVKLIQVKEAIAAQTTSTATTVTKIGEDSFEAATGNKPFETKAPYYEDKLKLKKGTTTIYTGQQESADKKGENVDSNGVLIATAQFGKNTTHTKIVKVEDTSYDQYEGGLIVTSVGDKIYAQAYTSEESLSEYNSDYTALGKHKIAVYATADGGMHQSKAELDVTVVEGIEHLRINVPTTSVYKTNKKAASFKATVDYNPGFAKAFAAKTKKVTWSIVDASCNEIEEGSSLNLVKIKNGTVTVDAKFVVSATDEEANKFRIKVTPADYYDSTDDRVRCSDVITITEQAQPIGDLVLAKANGGNSYEVLARNGDSVTAKELTGAQLFVLKRGTPEKAFTWDDALDGRNFDFKSGNKAVVLSAEDVQDEYYDNIGRVINVRVDKPANKVKLTATANDGSKQKTEMTINVNYDQVSEGDLGLRIYTHQPSYKENNPADEAEELSFDGTTSTEYYAEVVKKNGRDWEEISDYTDFKVSAKNAKFIANGRYGENITFVNTNNKAAEITLTYNVPKANGKGFDKKTRTYKVTNTGYTKAKAPKVKLSGGLTAGYYNGEQVITGDITLDKSMKDYSFKKKEVRVDPDWTKISSKNYDDYMRLADQLREAYVEDNGKLTLKFGLTNDGYDRYTNISAGSYSLKVTLGTRNYDSDTPWGEFVPDCQAASVTIKATARKVQKGSFKPATSYTLSLLDSAVELTGKGSNVKSVEFDSTLQNDNIKGMPNRFNKFFEVYQNTDDEDNKYYLQLKNNAIKEELAKPENAGKKLSEIIPQDDLTGYVSYTALVGSDQYGDPTEVQDTVKITVKLKDRAANKDDAVVKYAATNVSVLGGLANVEARIQITADKKPANIAYAYAVDTTKGDEFKDATANYNNVVTLTSTKIPSLGKHDIELYVIPEGTYWAGAIYTMSKTDSETTDAFNARVNQTIKDNGVKLAVKVTVEDPATKKGKIKLSGTNVVFTNDQYADDGSGNYWVEIPYTKVLDCEIDEIKVQDNDSSLIKNIIYFDDDSRYEEGSDDASYFIRACINKKELTDAIAASNNKLKWAQKNINVKTTVTFKSGSNADEGYDYGAEKIAEDVTFKVTLPKEPEVQKDFAEIVKDVKDNTEAVMNVELPDDWNVLNSTETDEDGYTEQEYVCNGVKWQIYENIKKYAPADSDVLIQLGGDAVNMGYTYSDATTSAEGSLVVPVTLVDLTTATPVKDEQGNITDWNIDNATKEVLESETGAGGYKFVIPKKSLSANDTALTDKLDELMTGLNASAEITVSNATTGADIRAYLLKGAKEILGTDLVLWVEVTDDNGEDGFTAATDAAAGKIIVGVIVQNRKGGEPFEKVYNMKDSSEAYVVIPKLATVTELAAAISNALADTTKFKASNSTTQEEVAAAIEEIIAEKNPDVTFAWAKKEGTQEDDYKFTAARIPHDANADQGIEADDGEGSITGKIVLTNENSAADDKSGECSFTITIAPLKKSDEAITAVKEAAIGETNAKKFAQSNVVATVKAAVLTAARDAVKDDPYVVDFKKDGENEVFNFTPVKWNEDGSISYTLEVKVKKADGTAGDVVVDTNEDLKQTAVTLAKNPALMTTADAKTAIAAELAKTDLTWTVANTDTETEALGKVKTQLEGYLPTGSGITVEVTKVSFEAATVKKAGSLVCSWKVVKGEDSASGDANITIAIEMIAQTKDEAATAVKEAGEKVEVTNDDFATEAATTAKQTAIENAVKAVVADKFTVEVKTVLTRSTEPTLNVDGAASIVFTIKEGAEDDSSKDATCSYKLVLNQTLAEAETAAEAAVKAYTASNTTVANDIITEINKVIKTSAFSAAWGEGEGKAFKLTPSAAADGENAATPGSITGEIVITETGTTNTATITVDITWEHSEG